MRRSLALLAVSGGVAFAWLPGVASAIQVQIVNHSGRPADRVFVMLHNGSSSDGQLSNDVAKPLSGIVNQRFSVDRIAAGRIFISYGAPVRFDEPDSSLTRYDKVELTYLHSPTDSADLTAVDFFGIPFDLQTLNSSGDVIATRHMAETSALLKALEAIPGASKAVVKDQGAFVRLLSPSHAQPGTYPSMAGYVRSMAGETVRLRGAFFGTPFTTFDYSGRFQNDGSVTLSGTLTPSGNQPSRGQELQVIGAKLPDAIYSGSPTGNYTVGGHSPAPNDVYEAMFRDLVSGFDWGYWNGKYGNDDLAWCTNPEPAGWCPTGWDRPPFAKARRGSDPFAAYNQYAAVIDQLTNAYGFPYSDTGSKNHVLLFLAGADTLRITILGDGSAAPVAPTGGKLLRALGVKRSAIVSHRVARIAEARCPPICGRLTVDASARGVLVGRASAQPARGKAVPVLLWLTRKGTALLTRHRSLRLNLIIALEAHGQRVGFARASLQLTGRYA